MFSTVGVLIFLATAGQNIRLVDGLKHTTLSPSPSALVLITQAANGKEGAMGLIPLPNQIQELDVEFWSKIYMNIYIYIYTVYSGFWLRFTI